MAQNSEQAVHDRWVDADTAAQHIGRPASYLARFRRLGGGPPFAKIGRGKQGHVRYRLSVLDAWMEAHTRASTSDQGGAR